MTGSSGLATVRTGKQNRPIRILVQGQEGVGKSTFAASAPNPIFICAEDGIAHLDVARFPEPKSLAEIHAAIAALDSIHPYQTLVVDTVDWLEPLIWAKVVGDHGQKSIEAFGWGRGYALALEQWRDLLVRLDRLRLQRNIGVILLAHTSIRSFANPDGENYDRYELKVHKQAAGLLKEWADAVLFAAYETATRRDGNKAKGVSTGNRVLNTTWSAAWDAKNRFGLPEQLPLDWTTFYKYCRPTEQAKKPDATLHPEPMPQVSAPSTPGLSEVESELLALVTGTELEARVGDMLAKSNGDIARVGKLLEWAKSRLKEK